jgi:hypothetical protein
MIAAPAAALRLGSRVVTQALYGEKVTVLATKRRVLHLRHGHLQGPPALGGAYRPAQ